MSERMQQKMMELQSEGVNWKVVGAKAAGLVIGQILFGFPGLAFAVYLSIGDSLAIRQGFGRGSTRYAGVGLLWPALLVLEQVLDNSEG